MAPKNHASRPARLRSTTGARRAADRTVIRRARPADLPALGRLGALLMHTHYAFNPQRFLAPGDNPDSGYRWFLRTQIRAKGRAIFIAERGGEVVGYVLAGLEPLSWMELRAPAGFIHDIVVDPDARRVGAARGLMETAIEWLRARGAPRVMLWVAEPNTGARQLFAALGFRPTMVEMTRELAAENPERGRTKNLHGVRQKT